MAVVVSLSQGVLSNLLALQNTTNSINTVQNQLATGKRVATALDDPTNFFLAESYQVNINTLNGLLDQINLGQRTIEAANSGITSITSLLKSAQGTLNQALGSAATTSTLTGTSTGLTSTTTLASLGFAATDVITVSDGTTNTATYTTAATTTVQSLLNFINTGGASTNGKVRAELAGDGRIILEGATAAAAITITKSGGSTSLQNLGFNAAASNGTVNNTAAAGTLNTTRQTLAAQFDALRTQIDQLAVDSQFGGVSLLNSQSLTVFTSAYSANAKVILTGNNDTAVGLGLTSTFTANTFQDNYEINATITAVKASLTQLQNQASTLASQVSIIETRANYTSETINNLTTGINNLTLADSNKVGAQLLALQTRQSLSSTALSLATQADQNVLRLFR